MNTSVGIIGGSDGPTSILMVSGGQSLVIIFFVILIIIGIIIWAYRKDRK